MVVQHFQLLGKKSTQEDAFYISEDNKMFVVCDGVGGHVNGELASNEIVNNLQAQYESACLNNTVVDLAKMVENAIISLNEKAVMDSRLIGSSTTLAILYFENERQALSVHIGDTRVILLRGNGTEYWATKDHSIVQELFDAGVLKTEDQMRAHPYKNRITRAITAGKEFSSDLCIQQVPAMERKDCFVVCSDGLLENYTNSDLQKLYDSNDSSAMPDILRDECEQNSKDNTTVMVISH